MSAPAAKTAPAPAPESREIAIFLAVIAVLGAGLVCATLLARRTPVSKLVVEQRPAARQLVDFSLTNWDGRTVTRADLKDRFVVVTFVFTSCSATCLEISRHMERIQTATAGRDDVRLLSFSMDPRTDQPPVLAQFARRCNADPARWFLLTGTKADVHGVIEASFLSRDPALVNEPSAGFRDHYAIALVDRTGTVRHYFNGLVPTAADDVLRALNELRKANAHP